MADQNFKQRYWGRLKQLQKEHIAARKVGDFALAKKKKEDIRRVASVPFDSYIRKVDDLPRPKGLGPAYPVNVKDYPGQDVPGEEGEREGGENAQFGQPVDAAQQQAQRAVGQEAADKAQQEVLGPQTTVKPKPEEPPGGFALKESKAAIKGPAAQQLPERKGGIRGLAQSGLDTGKQAFRQALDPAIKYLKKVAAQLAKRAVIWLFSTPLGWATIAVILGIIVLFIIILIFVAIVFGNHSKVSPTGATFNQPVNPLTDKEWLEKILNFAGDKATVKKLILEHSQEIQSDLTAIKTESPPDVATEIDAVLAKLAQISTDSSEDEIKAFVDALGAVVKKINPCAQVALDSFFDFGGLSADQQGFISLKMKRKDENSYVTPSFKLCNFLLAVKQNAQTIGISKLSLGCLVSTHPRKVAGGNGRDSAHYYGKAVDVMISPTSARPSQDAARGSYTNGVTDSDQFKLSKWIIDNATTLQQQGLFPSQLIGPWTKPWCEYQASKGKPSSCWYRHADHWNHIHIGF